jgi:serine/tyrosine/threonine adenylyltransferase
VPARFSFDNSYRRLSDRFHARIPPTPVAEPGLVALNLPLAAELGLDLAAADRAELAQLLAGNRLPEGAEPIAMAYAGHQFGHFVPQLGDGRAILLGEVLGHDGRRHDIQLKGAGPTPFSRSGDGRAALGPALREYIVSEAMHALGIPTTRSLAVVTTGEPVYRDRALPGAVLTRVAASHVRVGTFEYFGARGDEAAIRELVDYVVLRLYPAAAEAERPALALLEAVIERQARLVAQWMHVGFIHGVMNTDNMAISGETIDYGPCAFMDEYDPATVFSSIDRGGRYAWGNQPRIAQWNLARLAETLLPLIDADQAVAIERSNALLNGFAAAFEQHWQAGLRHKLGLVTQETGDTALIEELLAAMQAAAADFTLTFRRLCDAAEDAAADKELRSLFNEPAAFDRWAVRWRERLARDPQSPAARARQMRRSNPAFIPRNHRVEQALAAAVEHGDFAPFNALLAVLARPYEDAPEHAAYATPPQSDERVLQTFCGT